MKAIERHRQTWQGKSDEWLFERLNNELKQKVEEIHHLFAENEALRQFDVMKNEVSVCDNPHCDRGIVGEVYGEKMYCNLCHEGQTVL